MNEKNQRFDLRTIIESISDVLRDAGNFASESMQPAKVWIESGLRQAVLVALLDGPKTGHEIISTITEANEWGIKPAAAKVYPLLESLLDEQLVSVKMVNDRKVYALTKTGKVAEKAAEGEGVPRTAPQWPGFNADLTTASRRLAKAAFDVSQHGTKQQQTVAAEAIDEARRKIHEILASK